MDDFASFLQSTVRANTNNEYVLSMARSAHPDSAGSQFFICLGDCAFLDGQYTGFGELESGVEVLEAIGETPCAYGAGGEKSRPTERVEVKKVTIG